MHYLDNAATTIVNESVANVADDILRKHFANPSALYNLGMHSENIINESRKTVAKAFNCTPSEVYFTASGTEGNNIAIQGACKARTAWANHIVATGYEHPCVRNTCTQLQNDGFSVSFINPEKNGEIDIEKIVDAVTNKTAIVCAMHVNNEIGSIIDVELLAKKVKDKNSRTVVHIDGVQAFGKIKLNLANTKIDTYAVSGHKIYAPKGIGALYIKNKFNITNILYGAKQENGMRPGTENIAYIAAFAKACSLTNEIFFPDALKEEFINEVKNIEEITVNSPSSAHPAIINICVKKIKSETMLHFLESKQIYVSAGASCSKGANSHTLTAMGMQGDIAQTALRISFGKSTSKNDINALVNALKEGINSITKMN